jgi:hypothetical protein
MALIVLFSRFRVHHLCELDLHKYHMKDSVLWSIRRLSGLHTLSIAIRRNCTPEKVAATVSALPQLRTLALHNNTMQSLTMEKANVLGRCCTKLTSLTFGNFKFLPTFTPLLSQLQRLSLTDVKHSHSIRSVAQHCRHLKYLTFYRAIPVVVFTTDKNDAPRLRYVDMSSPESVKDSAILSVAVCCKMLLEHRAVYRSELVAAGAGTLHEPGPVLSVELRLQCPRHPACALRVLQERNPEVDIFLER